MKTLKYLTLAVIFAVALASCAITQQPPQAQLALACQSLAAAYNTAAGYRARGKLSPAAIATLTSFEAPAQAVCNKNNPPADVNSALAQINAYLQQWALIQAGVPTTK